MIIETAGLRKAFGRLEAIHDLNLLVPEGSVFALIGPNGTGKTTTIRMLMNILQPDAGSITVLGTDSRDLEPRHFQDIGYVSESQRVPDRLTIAQYFSYLKSLYTNWDVALQQELCTQFELPATRKLKHLSHGMRMKALLVGALAFRPRLLVLDEPLSGLDTLVREEVVNGLLQQASETTILISSHELSEIESFTTHVAFMQRGNLLLQEEIETLHNRFRVVNVTLAGIKTLPEPVPAHWLLPEVTGHQFRFYSANFTDEQSTYRELVAHFGPAKVSVDTMSLRGIAVALMQEDRRRRNGRVMPS